MFGKTLPVIVLVLVYSVPGFGQKEDAQKEKIEKPCQQPQIHAEGIGEAQKNQEIEFRGIQGHIHLGKFIPEGADAWGVKIVTTGGFSGNGLPTVRVFSDGEVFVEYNNPAPGNALRAHEIRELSADVLQKISQIVLAQTLTEKAKNIVDTQMTTKETLFLCNDCYQTSITIVRRDPNGKPRFFSNREKNLLFSTGDFNRIYEIIKENTGVLN